MQINLITVGKIKEEYLNEAIKEYTKRIGKYSQINIMQVKDEAIRENTSVEAIKETEGKRIIEVLPNGYSVLLDLRGKQLTSIEFSSKIEEICNYHSSTINFIIGGSLGVSDSVLKKADYLISFSKMTFPHQLMRVILLEQIYRSFKILNNETYHK